jgi:hypothetical protein
MKTIGLVVGMLALSTFALFGCSRVENAVDCHGICSRYQSCFDSSYDTNVCETRCRDNANTDDQYEQKVDACKSCIDDKSCASATFNCATQCAGIVP